MSASDYYEFTSEFAHFLAQIPGRGTMFTKL